MGKLKSLKTKFEKTKPILIGISVLILFIIPFINLNSYYINVINKVLIYVLMALGLNILVGYTGLVSLGQAGFVAIGAYATTILTTKLELNFFLATFIALLIAAGFGILLGLPTLRLSGPYLTIVTLGFGEIIRTIIIVWDSVTNGPLGIRNIPMPSIFGFELTVRNGGLYLLTLICTLLVMIFSVKLYKGKVGRAMRAIKADERASVMMGINTTYYKVLAFVLAAVICALAGALYAPQLGYIDQDTFTFDMSTMILSIVILGGMGTIRGMVVGSVVLVVLPEMSRSLMDYRFVLYGLVLVFMMRFRPQGLLGWRDTKPYPLSDKVRESLGIDERGVKDEL